MIEVRGRLAAEDYVNALLLTRRHNRTFLVVRVGLWTLIAVFAVVYGIAALGDARF